MNVATDMPRTSRARKPSPTAQDQHRVWLTEIHKLEEAFVAAPAEQLEPITSQISALDAKFAEAPIASAEGAVAKLEYISDDMDPFRRNVVDDVIRFLRGDAS